MCCDIVERGLGGVLGELGEKVIELVKDVLDDEAVDFFSGGVGV